MEIDFFNKMKCDECGKEIKKTFLNKIIGTVVKKDGKKLYLCNECQKLE